MITIHYPPRQGSKEEYDDLMRVIYQYENKLVPEELQRRCDEDSVGLFVDYLRNRDIDIPRKKIDQIKNSVKSIIIYLKENFNRPRPSHVAKFYDIDWTPDYLDSAQTASYPSGHTIQAYVCAGWLADQYPEHSKGLFMIAELISQSRIDRGVHFHTDIDYGRVVAKDLLNALFLIL
jgi:acid phosphatase (class A)